MSHTCARAPSVDHDRGLNKPRKAPARSVLIIQCEHGKAREPVLSHIVPGDMGKACGQMLARRFVSNDATRVVCRQGVAERAPAPGAAEIESVEMSDLAVGAIGDGRRLEQRCRLALRPAAAETDRTRAGTRPAGNRRRMHSASIRAEDWKSSPLGSPQAGQSVSSPYQRRPVSRSSLASASSLLMPA